MWMVSNLPFFGHSARLQCIFACSLKILSCIDLLQLTVAVGSINPTTLSFLRREDEKGQLPTVSSGLRFVPNDSYITDASVNRFVLHV